MDGASQHKSETPSTYFGRQCRCCDKAARRVIRGGVLGNE